MPHFGRYLQFGSLRSTIILKFIIHPFILIFLCALLDKASVFVFHKITLETLLYLQQFCKLQNKLDGNLPLL